MLSTMKDNNSTAQQEHPQQNGEEGPSAANAAESVVDPPASPLVSSAPGTANGVDTAQSSSPVVSANARNARDSSWLELEVCREHLRATCPRTTEECRFAHPEPRILVKDGKVTCCYDFLKDRCHREKCRYFHPPPHIKDRLVSAGKSFGAMMSNLYLVQTGSYPGNLPPMLPPSVPLVAPVIYGLGGRVMSAAPPGFPPSSTYAAVSDRIEICPDFVQGRCNMQMCPLVHPEPHVRRNLDSTVTVCRDFLRGGCSREKCRYFHPAGSLLPNIGTPRLMQQGMMVASSVVPVFPPMMYPIPGPMAPVPPPDPATIPSSGLPMYPPMSLPPVGGPVPMPLPVAMPPPGMVAVPVQVPISTITSAAVPKEVAFSSQQSIIMAPGLFQH